MKLLRVGKLQLVCGRPTFAHSFALVPQTLSCLICVEEPKQKCCLGTASNEITAGGGGGGGGGLQLVCGRPTFALSSALVPQTLSCLVCVEDS